MKKGGPPVPAKAPCLVPVESAPSNLAGIGQRLIGIRIYLGLSQRELAQRLEVHESQVSRDEKNEYHGITVERVEEILTALGANMTSSFEIPTPKAAVGGE